MFFESDKRRSNRLEHELYTAKKQVEMLKVENRNLRELKVMFGGTDEDVGRLNAMIEYRLAQFWEKIRT